MYSNNIEDLNYMIEKQLSRELVTFTKSKKIESMHETFANVYSKACASSIGLNAWCMNSRTINAEHHQKHNLERQFQDIKSRIANKTMGEPFTIPVRFIVDEYFKKMLIKQSCKIHISQKMEQEKVDNYNNKNEYGVSGIHGMLSAFRPHLLEKYHATADVMWFKIETDDIVEKTIAEFITKDDEIIKGSIKNGSYGTKRSQWIDIFTSNQDFIHLMSLIFSDKLVFKTELAPIVNDLKTFDLLYVQ